ncbi:MAG TPA: hypothetical protein VFG23_15215 [Polyangia bacterium]|nr:hypothetical protein [Polyangia bacterium]
MTTVAEVDRQVNSDDAIAARLWPKLGPKVRTAYHHDRDAWTAIGRDVDTGKQPSAETLAGRHKTFAGWARALRAVSTAHKHRPSARPTVTAPAPVAIAAAAIAPPPAAAETPALAAVKGSTGCAGQRRSRRLVWLASSRLLPGGSGQ